MDIKVSDFGLISGREIKCFTFKNTSGQYIELLNYGGIVHSWFCFDNNQILKDVLLGCPDMESYLDRHPYFGCIIGRYGNRINNGTFKLNGVEYHLNQNLKPHHLHGGIDGFDKKIYSYDVTNSLNSSSLILTATSPDMEEGYPGNLSIKVIYTFTEKNELIIEYFAKTDKDTHINLTNHCYFNLSGDSQKTIIDHYLSIAADNITETNDSLVSTGAFVNVFDTNVDFLTVKKIGDRIYADDHLIKKCKGYDHNFVINEHEFNTPVATLLHKSTGRRLLVFTTEPALQLYTGNWLDNVKGKTGLYQDYAGVCLETQHYPDTPNHPNFPSTILKKGKEFYSKTIYCIDCLPL
ncbi:MAG: galactose mutarotase [Saprospiraceae bacterium]|nr:galactose mutarotase [Saprospiraceae bacterium]